MENLFYAGTLFRIWVPLFCQKDPFSLLMLLFWEENRRFGTLVGVKRLQSEPTCSMLIYFIPVKCFGIILSLSVRH